MNAKYTHKKLIMFHLETIGSITPMDAWDKYHITKLATRISELRREGHDIVGIRIDTVNQYGNPTHYMKYSLREG